jgi:D-amino-acid dehydrogenase
VKVLVLGAGVVGVTAAYYLTAEGYQVTLLERRTEVASESSYGNAGLITPGDSYAWASPEALKVFLKSLYRRDLGIKVRLRLDPSLLAWSWRFLLQCSRERTRINTLRKLRLTSYSRECLNELVAETGVDYDGQNRGVLYFYRSQESLDHGVEHMRLLAENGLDIQVLDREGLVTHDPGLKGAKDQLAGGIYSPMDQTGDSRKFARELANWCVQHKGLELALDTTVTDVEVEARRVQRIITDRGPFAADAIVLAMGCDSPWLARRVGVRLPIYPVKGYSLTLPLANPDCGPRLGGVDEDKLVAYSRLGQRLRMAATAEFAGNDRSFRPADFAVLKSVGRELFPDLGDFETAELWAGLRPMTPSSVPILGRAGCTNFYLDVGHGHVGWTMACGSGKFLADAVAGRRPQIDPEGFLYEG